MNIVITTLGLTFIICTILIVLVVVLKYSNLYFKHKRLSKYLYNYLNVITSARYGNLNSKCEDGVDALTIQLSRNTNALLESVFDRDMMISEYIEKEKQTQNIKQDFISSLAHDLKVPIIAQDNTYDLFLNNNFGELTDIQKSAIKNLKISNNDLKNLIADLLDAHKLDKQQLTLNIENININKLINEAINQNKSILTIKEKEIIFNYSEEIEYPLDSFLIKRVLNNLISNAIFYGKNSKNITIELAKTQYEIIISVIDEGDGIKEEDINNIFTKYYTSAKKYSNIGVGLGLYIANKIVLAHNGKIEAKNNIDKGACFTIVLPL
ncbi:MAG: HAMP domain-containing histidine kinase, partial [Candidatus Gastranaerophilales bacterium]|nr:HAMP domain-containing histidine kinase [Candidatus Gastranaerophilales bacterium]